MEALLRFSGNFGGIYPQQYIKIIKIKGKVMAGSVSKRNQYRIFRIFEKGYYNSDKEYDAVFELIRINCFMPSDRKFIEETFKRLYEYYPNTFEECMKKHKKKLKC